MKWNSTAVRTLIRLALNEDTVRDDVTTNTLIPRGLRVAAEIRAKAPGVVCGLPMAGLFFKALDSKILFSAKVREGQAVKPGTLLAALRGQARAVLSAERCALNTLQHLSGVATYTHEQVRRLKSRHTAIFDTRKTLPGWRELQKYAVRCGGGRNHRFSLKESVLIKDNHLALCRLIGTDWMAAIKKLRKQRPGLMVEMEIQTERDLQDALRLSPQQVLLDNMRPARLKSLIKRLRPGIPGVELEVSGGVRTDQLAPLGRLGVERISMGRLTHSAPAFDCSLDITHVFHTR